MPCGVKLITGIADSDIGGLEQAALLDQPTRTIRQQADNGEWTLTIVFPPCPDGSDPLTTTVHGQAGAPQPLGPAGTTPQAFVQSHLADAQVVKRQCLVPIAVTLAQSGLETGWGRAVVGNAFFGIKAEPGQQSVVATTHEFDATGHSVSQPAAFCSYASYGESALAYGNFLLQNARYRPAFQHTSDPEAFAMAVAAAGFATDPAYGTKLVQIMREQSLEQFDRPQNNMALAESRSDPPRA